jgi:hypothetical protein
MNDPEEQMELATLLEEARMASPGQRIEWRDRIVAHGPQAIEGVRPWLADDVLAPFAVRVIEHAGLAGNDELAAKVLRGARKKAPEAVTGDIEWALRHLREASRPPAPTPPTRTPAGGNPRREAPRYTADARPRPR